MLLEDTELSGLVENHIREKLVNAESAVRYIYNDARARFQRMNDSYFRERIRDIDDLERRLLCALTGFGDHVRLALREPSIIIADDLTPSETVQLPRDLVLGFATNGGSPTSHVALLARAMGIPAVTGLGDITSRVHAGERVAIDGVNGTITLCPDAATIREYADLIERDKEIFGFLKVSRIESYLLFVHRREVYSISLFFYIVFGKRSALALTFRAFCGVRLGV